MVLFRLCFLALTFSCALGKNDPEAELIHDVMSHLHLKRCILLTIDVHDESTRNKMKFLMQRHILTVVMDLNDLIQHFSNDYTQIASHSEVIVGSLQLIAASELMSWTNRAPRIAKNVWLAFPIGDLAALNYLKVPYNCQFIILHREDPMRNDFALYEFYDLNGSSEFTNFASWSEDRRLELSSHEFFYRRRFDFKGSQLNMLRAQEIGYESDQEYANVQLWLAIGEMMNFTTRMITKETKKNEPFIIADVGSETHAFHANVLSFYGDSLQLLAPIRRTQSVTRMFMHVRHQVDERLQWAAYLRPLSLQVWLCCAFILLFGSFCLTIIGYQISRKKVPLPCIAYGFTPLDAICSQGGVVIGQRLSKRIAIACLRIWAIAIMHAYSGVIVSKLTFQYSVYPFNDLSEFVKSGEYRMSAVTDTFGAGYFRLSQDPLAIKVANELFEPRRNLPRNILDGMRRCCNGKYVFLADEDASYSVDRRLIPCQIMKIPTPAFAVYGGMMLYEFSEYRRVFFFNLLSFYSTGFLKKYGEKWKRDTSSSRNYEDVEINQVYSVLALLACGIFLSYLLIMVERIYIRRRK